VRRQNPKIASEMSLGRRRRARRSRVGQGQGGQALGPEGTTRAARRAMKASGSRSTDAVPSDHGFLKSSLTFPSSRILRRSLARGGAPARPPAHARWRRRLQFLPHRWPSLTSRSFDDPC
jgi:hypothetical protein